MPEKKFIKKTFILILIILIYFLICEQIVRVEFFGMNAFSPRLMENIQFSTTYEFLEGDCDMKAKYSDYYKGAFFETNSIGIRDKEYNLEKNNNTFRIAIIGDSQTKGIGINLEDTYPKILEKKLNEKTINKSYEVMNFARGGIHNENYQCYLKKTIDALHYNPDMIILQLYQYNKFFENTTQLKNIEKYDENAYFIIMFFDKNNNYIEKYQNLTDIPIVSLNVSHTKKDLVYPADWHFNEEIHLNIANSLNDYLIFNEEYIYEQTKNLTKAKNLPELIKPPVAKPIKNSKTGFEKLYYVEKIEKRFGINFILKKAYELSAKMKEKSKTYDKIIIKIKRII